LIKFEFNFKSDSWNHSVTKLSNNNSHFIDHPTRICWLYKAYVEINCSAQFLILENLFRWERRESVEIDNIYIILREIRKYNMVCILFSDQSGGWKVPIPIKKTLRLETDSNYFDFGFGFDFSYKFLVFYKQIHKLQTLNYYWIVLLYLNT